MRCTKLVELFETTVFSVEPYLRWKFRCFQEQVPRLSKRSTEVQSMIGGLQLKTVDPLTAAFLGKKSEEMPSDIKHLD